MAPGAERAHSSLVVPGIVHVGLQCAAELTEVFRSFPRTAMSRSQWTWPSVLFQTLNAEPQVPRAPWACGEGRGCKRIQKTAGPHHPALELLASHNCQSVETWLKISLNAKLSLKPLVLALLETGHRVKIETLNHLVFLSFIQLCCEVQSPLANKLCLKRIRCAGTILSG